MKKNLQNPSHFGAWPGGLREALTINRLLMVNGSWLMAKGSCRRARGSRPMAHGQENFGAGSWAMNHETLTIINNQLINELFEYILKALGITYYLL